MEAAEPPASRFSISAFDGSLDVTLGDLTLSANAVLTSASTLCEELRNSRVEPCHVAYRLYVDDVAGVGGQILARAGVDPGPVKKALEELVSGLTVVQAAFGGRGVTFSQPFVELMKSARKEQRLTRDKVIGLDHIALACAHESIESLEILSTLGLGLADIRAAVEKLKGSPQVVLSPRPSPEEGAEGESSPGEQLAQLASDDADDDSLYEDY
jgi:ATP-dependent Clp protease ATP-binding subunit ClpA|eukprot:COSAG02_NODE_6155_length_3763_cov_2.523745_4_plen_213_part_00